MKSPQALRRADCENARQKSDNSGVVILTGGPVYPPNFGAEPRLVKCFFCNHLVTTQVTVTPSIKTHLYALFLCLCCCWLCSCVPYCIDSCQSRSHYCPNCNALIGVNRS